MGRYVTAGAIARPVVRLDLRTLYLKQLELVGSTMGTHEEFASLVEHIASGRIKPLQQLYPEVLQAACAEAGQPLTLRWCEGYDHGYYFISTFMEDHIEHHAEALNAS